MTDCNREPLLFSSLGRQEIGADFNGGRLTSDAGGLLLREADRRLGLTPKLAACIPDPRDPLLVIHQQETMLAKRVFGIALGYEDLNDHDTRGRTPCSRSWQTGNPRRTVSKGTEVARAHVSTIRLKLLKVAARVVTSVRRVVFHLASSYPWQTLFRQIVKRLVPQ